MLRLFLTSARSGARAAAARRGLATANVDHLKSEGDINLGAARCAECKRNVILLHGVCFSVLQLYFASRLLRWLLPLRKLLAIANDVA